MTPSTNPAAATAVAPVSDPNRNTREGQVRGGRSLAERIITGIAFTILVFVALLMFVPFLFSLATSFKTAPDAASLTFGSMFWPREWSLAAYRTALDSNIQRWFLNSALVAVIWVVGRAAIDTLAGYAFARMQFPGRDFMFTLILGTMMVPGIVMIIPRFILLKDLGILNTYGALTIPFLADAFGIFLMKQFFESIPIDLEDAARTDGATRFQIFRTIVLPNAVPAVSALAIFSFQGSWNNFLEPLIFISGGNTDLYTLPVGLANFKSQYQTNWPVLMSIAVITTVPIAIFFLVFQRYFIASNVSSGVKG